MPELPKGNDEVLIALGAKAKETGADSFYVRVERKGQMGLPESLTYCEEAELVHLAKPEDWLPSLFGGGSFILTCFHPSDRTVPLGRLLYNFKGQPQANWPVLDSATWSGPKKVSRPSVQEQHGQTFAETDAPAPRGWGGASRFQGGFQGYGPPPPFYPPAASPVVEKTLEQIRSDSAARDRQFAEARSQDRELFTRLFDKLSQPPPPKSLDGAAIAALITAGTTIVTAFVQSSKEARAEQVRLAAEQAKETRELVKAISQPRVDPVIERMLNEQRKLVEKLADSGGNENEAMMQQMQVMQQMFGFTTKAMSIAAEAQLGSGEKGGGLLPAFREAVQALEHIFTARTQAGLKMGGAQGGVQGGQPQLPAQAQAQSPRTQGTAAAKSTGPTVVDRLIESIVAHQDIKVLAATVVKLGIDEDPEFMAALTEHNGDLVALANARLGNIQEADGTLWALQPKNQLYARSLIAEVERQWEAANEAAAGEPEEATPEVAATPASAPPSGSPPVVTKFENTKPASA